MQPVGVIGAGAWGTALAQMLALSSGRDVLLWTRRAEQAAAIRATRENSSVLPGISLHPRIAATSEARFLAPCSTVLVVTPAQYVRETLRLFKPHLGPGTVFVLCAKGIEISSGKLLSLVAEEELPYAPCAILTGPNFAGEVAEGLPAAATLACRDRSLGEDLCRQLSSRTFRLYASDDPIGAQIGGAVKNVIAIACGVVFGLGYGENARAALVARGLAEMARLSQALGGRRETLMGLCGVGDLVLTCSSLTSRNFSLGVELGQGKSLAEILSARRSVTEGVPTARALTDMASVLGVEMPLCTAVDALLRGGQTVDTIVDSLLDRPLRAEAG